jgi:hypothetical protein
MDINNRIKKIGNYFQKMNIAEGIIFVSVVFPNDWQMTTSAAEKLGVKIMNTEDGQGYYFATQIENGFNPVFDAIDKVIEFNEVAGIKKALFLEKIKELQVIFEEESLDVLQTIEFKYKKKRTNSKKVENNIENFETCQQD